WVISPTTGWDFETGYDEFSPDVEVKFIAPGSYSVELKVTNDNGTQSTVKTNFIDVIDYCIPTVALPNVSDVGINLVKLGTIDNTSSSGKAPGYSNYSKDHATVLTAGQTYEIEIARNSV